MKTPKEKLRKAIIDMLFEVEMKPLLEENIEISELYDNGEITHDDFSEILKELKNKMK